MSIDYRTFEEIITQSQVTVKDKKIELKPGMTILSEHLRKDFKKLFRPSGMSKNIGHGEVAIYWLFSNKFGGLYDVTKQEQSNLADFLIDDIPVEIKAWRTKILTSHNPIKIGRFEQQHDIRRVIHILFGAYNVFVAGQDELPLLPGIEKIYGRKSYLSESCFGILGLTKAFKCAFRLRDLSIDYLTNLYDILDMEDYKNLKTPKDFAAKTLALLAIKKMSQKVGSYNYIINIDPRELDRIEIFQLGNIKDANLDIIKDNGIRVACSELFVNLQAFRNNKL